MAERSRNMGLAAAALAAGLALGVAAAPAAPSGPAVLARRCYSCHDTAKNSGGIDLTSAPSLRASGVTGDRLLRAVRTGKMPPTGRLPAAEVDALGSWVRQGMLLPESAARPAAPRGHPAQRPLWSVQPITAPRPPRTRFERLARTDVDRFIFQRLEAAGLRPAPHADRRTLLRRVTLDLTGLPPTPEEVGGFLADRSPGAYERVVDRLLASPAYGERWARHWLDVVRFGESHGYEQNHLRPNAWPYRDYVIRALNEDRPYDRFITEQLAGDVVGKGDPDTEAATGFLVAGVHDTVGNQTEEGTRLKRANDLDDIVATTAETFLGLTVGCARCHDHKFDPVPQKDYYRLAAVFAGVQHAERPLTAAKPDPDARARAEALIRQARVQVGQVYALESQAREALLREQGASTVPRRAVSAAYNEEIFPPVTARFVRFEITSTRDGAQPCLDELEAYGPGSGENLALASGGGVAGASSLLPGYPIHQVAHLNDGRYGNESSWISNDPGRGWAQIELLAERQVARVVWSRDGGDPSRFSDRLPAGYRVLVSRDGREWQTVATGDDRAPAPEAIPPTQLLEALTAAERAERLAAVARLAELRKDAAAALPIKTAYVGQFSTPDPVYLLRRGDVMQRAEPVTPAGLSQLPGCPGELFPPDSVPAEPERRLALARWLCDPRNPLTRRVIVNRVWQHHFGRGLVGTPSDLGRNGEAPSHPELLDYLAHGFSRGDFRRPAAAGAPRASLKSLHRLLVTSYVYLQDHAASPIGIKKDAGNRLLWRMPLRRLEAEAIRDAVLAAGGKLDRRMGGPGFHLFKYRVVNVAIYEAQEEFGPETWRRGIYRQAARGIREELLGTFDCPESAQRTPRRENTTTALQALSLLNGPFMTQQAGFFAERVARDAGPDPAAQVRRAFLLAFGRSPLLDEATAARGLAAGHGMPALCRALLNANEFLYY